MPKHVCIKLRSAVFFLKLVSINISDLLSTLYTEISIKIYFFLAAGKIFVQKANISLIKIVRNSFLQLNFDDYTDLYS